MQRDSTQFSKKLHSRAQIIYLSISLFLPIFLYIYSFNFPESDEFLRASIKSIIQVLAFLIFNLLATFGNSLFSLLFFLKIKTFWNNFLVIYNCSLIFLIILTLLTKINLLGDYFQLFYFIINPFFYFVEFISRLIYLKNKNKNYCA